VSVRDFLLRGVAEDDDDDDDDDDLDDFLDLEGVLVFSLFFRLVPIVSFIIVS